MALTSFNLFALPVTNAIRIVNRTNDHRFTYILRGFEAGVMNLCDHKKMTR